MNFSITDGKGFYMKLPNGYGISVQFGPHNYADHYNTKFENPSDYEGNQILCGKRGSDTAECAVISPKGQLMDLPDVGDQVTNRSGPEEVLKLIIWASSLSGDIK